MKTLLKLAKSFVGIYKAAVAALSGKKQSRGTVRPWLEFYDADVPPAIYIPNVTLNDLLQRSVEFHPHQKAVSYYGAHFTFADLDKLIKGTAAGLLQIGLKKGDRLAVLLPNTPQFIIAYWAALRVGIIVAPVNPLLAATEVETVLKLVTPQAILVLDQLYKRNKSAIDDAGIRHVIHTSIDSFMPSMTRFVYFLKSGFSGTEKKKRSAILSFDRLYLADADPLGEPMGADDGAVLLFTGGVTGTPKAVLLQHKQLVANVLQTRMWMGSMKDGQEIILGVLPFSHSYGMTACHHLAIQSGSMLVLEPRFKAPRIIRLLTRYKATVFPGVPTMFRAIVDKVKDKKKLHTSLRFCVSGGAPLDNELKKDFEDWLNCRLFEGYGLTEAAPLTHCTPIQGVEKPGSIGLPCPNTDARIVDIKTKRPLPPNKTGELQVKGPQVMSGYWENAKETANVLNDGWLSTGDIAKMDEQGYFYIVDRKKDMILSGGFNVYPIEVEQVLNRHPAVEESAVVGVKDEYFGEAVKAFVHCRNGNACTEEALDEYCKERLAVYKRPAHYEFIDSLPKNFIGKIIRRQLTQQ